MFADIIVDITHEKLDKRFQYKIPLNLTDEITIGTKVLIPFGRGNKEIVGYVVGISGTASLPEERIKEIKGVSPKSIAIEETLIRLAGFVREQYGGTMMQALKAVLPIKTKEKEKEEHYVRLGVSKEEAKEKLAHLLLYKNQKARVRALSALLDHSVLKQEILRKQYKVDKSVINALVSQGLVIVETKRIYRSSAAPWEREVFDKTLNKEQKDIISRFIEDYDAGIRRPCLIHGVTGSGKTEVYIKLAEEVIKRGRQVIILIPEIALTFQTVKRFMGSFGNRVAIMNSRLSLGERSDQMELVRSGQVDVMIGPRSALFAPFEKLGLIVIDEEHEATYKSEQVPRYHAREVAIKRGELEGACVVMGSATPSISSYYRCMKGEYQLFQLPARATKNLLPKVDVVDMKEELKSGNRSILSRQLHDLIADRLTKREQVMLFLNRRGYAGFISCRSCGYVMKCPHCDVSLSIHRGGRMICHYCNYETPEVTLCPKCGSSYIGGFRAGTQQVEALIQREFKGVRTLRMDMDTTRDKDSYTNILKAFDLHEADILIGTQMIVKGHDFKGVTLVGALAADMSLYANDYQAGEKTFQLLTQAAGRAGRGETEGKVIIQTYNPKHYAIQMAKNQDYEGFYKAEIAYRDLMEYPPVYHLVAILLTGEEDAVLEEATGYLKKFIDMLLKGRNISAIGPSIPYVQKIKDIYRRVIYIKAENYNNLIIIKDKIEEYIEINPGFKKLHVQFDFDPMHIF